MRQRALRQWAAEEAVGTEASSELWLQAHYMLKPFILRRLKTEVELSLPLKHEFKIMVA